MGIDNFWKKYWDFQSQKKTSDYEVDRGVPFQGKKIEYLTERKLLELIDPKATDFVLDAGCGTGVNLKRLYGKVKGIIGMDYSEGMISRAKKRIIEENIANAGLIVGSICDTGFKNNTFNKIICISVLQYLSDEECESAFKEFVRISKDGAIVVLHIKNLSSVYMSTLYLAKKIKTLVSDKVILEYYRPYKWYEQKLFKLGAQVVDYDSANVLLVDFLPRCLFNKLKLIELRYHKGKFLKKHGADVNMKIKISKAQ